MPGPTPAAVIGPVTTEIVLEAIVRILGFAALAGGTAGAVAFVYRWYAREAIADGVAVLVGVTVVAGWLNTRSALGDAIIGETALLDPETAVFTVTAFAVSAITASGGRRLGDRLARDVFAVATPRTFGDVNQLVRSAGRVVAVTLPETVADAEGYDPIDEETKAELAGETLLFPRRLSTTELRDRFVKRLERDYGVGGVDVDFAPDGTVERLAVGSRPSGIGPTLAPGSVAVAIRADPASDASPGDSVEVWAAGDGEPRRLTAAELRAVEGDVATVALDAAAADALEADRTHRLVTLPGAADAGRQFVSLCRTADETVTAVTLEAEDSLVGRSVGSLPVLVLAIDREGSVLALPDDDDRLAVGDVAYLLGRPETLREVGER